jgi:hypothetical protein
MARPEKPHMGKLALPFMNSRMSLDLTSWSIRCCASLMAGVLGKIDGVIISFLAQGCREGE